MRVAARLAAILALLPAWTGLAAVQPSWACGCGAMITSGSGVNVAQETSIIRFDDRTATEQIVMRLSVRSRARDAAWLFPTPSAAQVRLGERSWFDQLERLTEPRVVKRRTWFPGLRFGSGDNASVGAPRGGGVSVLGEKHLGPFTVATLAADDPAALASWLRRNGYRLSPRLEGALAPYVAKGWKYVAVKLDPGRGQSIDGELDPLHVTFGTREIVYPMRLSRLASSPQSVHLYVLAPHRVERVVPVSPRAEVPFAGWVEPAQVAAPELRRFLGGRLFLTEAVNGHLEPTSITDDFRYRYTADTAYRETIYETERVEILGLPGGWVLVAAGAALAAVLTVMPVVLVRTRRRARP